MAITLLPNVTGTVANWGLQGSLTDGSGNGLTLSVDTGAAAYLSFSGIQFFAFNGATNLIAPVTALLRIAGDVTVQFLIIKASNANEHFFACESVAHPGAGGSVYASHYLSSKITWDDQNADTNLSTTPGSFGAVHLWGYRRSAGVVTFFLDGQPAGSITPGSNTSRGDERLRIGSWSGHNDYNIDKIASFRIDGVARSDADMFADFQLTLGARAPFSFSASGALTAAGALRGTAGFSISAHGALSGSLAGITAGQLGIVFSSKRSIFSPLITQGKPGGSAILDRSQAALKRALDVIANGLAGNVSEKAGVWTVSGGPSVPNSNPPEWSYYVYRDPADGKWKSRGWLGTTTTLGQP